MNTLKHFMFNAHIGLPFRIECWRQQRSLEKWAENTHAEQCMALCLQCTAQNTQNTLHFAHYALYHVKSNFSTVPISTAATNPLHIFKSLVQLQTPFTSSNPLDSLKPHRRSNQCSANGEHTPKLKGAIFRWKKCGILCGGWKIQWVFRINLTLIFMLSATKPPKNTTINWHGVFTVFHHWFNWQCIVVMWHALYGYARFSIRISKEIWQSME